jgi:phage-related protein
MIFFLFTVSLIQNIISPILNIISPILNIINPILNIISLILNIIPTCNDTDPYVVVEGSHLHSV